MLKEAANRMICDACAFITSVQHDARSRYDGSVSVLFRCVIQSILCHNLGCKAFCEIESVLLWVDTNFCVLMQYVLIQIKTELWGDRKTNYIPACEMAGARWNTASRPPLARYHSEEMQRLKISSGASMRNRLRACISSETFDLKFQGILRFSCRSEAANVEQKD